MSSREKTDTKPLQGARHKSSDRLHRMGGKGSHLNLSKRSKSYSQIMSTVATSSNGKKKDKKLNRKEAASHAVEAAEEEGWTSSSQSGTPKENSRSPSPASDEEEDEGLMMGTRKKQDVSLERPSEMKRTDTSSTLKKEEPEKQIFTVSSHEHLPNDMHVRQSSVDTLTNPSRTEENIANDTTKHIPRVWPQEQGTRPDFRRTASSASAITLTGRSGAVHESSASPISMKSFRGRSSLLPRESHHAVPPKLSTDYAFAGSHGLDNRDQNTFLPPSLSESSKLNDKSFDSAQHYRVGTTAPTHRHRKLSTSSSRSSFINLTNASPSMAHLSHEAANAETSSTNAFRAVDAMQRASGSMRSGLPRQRTESSQSTGAFEAAKLTNKLRTYRADASDDGALSNASRMLASSGSKYFSGPRPADGPVSKAMAQYNKPTVSTFVSREDDLKSIEKLVLTGSLFDENFARASLSGDGMHKGEAHEGYDEDSTEEFLNVRYTMDFGLGGPTLQKTPTTQALLSTCLDQEDFEPSWAPTLAHTADLGHDPRPFVGRSGSAEHGVLPLDGIGLTQGLSGGIFINGPNATPLHFLHGLTNINDNPFPLDASDIAGPGAALSESALAVAPQGEYLDAKNLRAVALTWAALNATKNHIMTRRYLDPMRESMERVTSAGSINFSNNKTSFLSNESISANGQGHRRMNSASIQGNTTPGGSLRWPVWRNIFGENQAPS